MDWTKIFKFLLPEYQIIESIKENGFIAKPEKRAQNASRTYEQGRTVTRETAYGQSPYPTGSPSFAGQRPQTAVRPEPTRDADMSKRGNRHRSAQGSASAKTPTHSSLGVQFDRAREQLSAGIIGQQNFLDQLMIAFKRPFVAGYDRVKPKNTMVVLGANSTGRHTCIEAAVTALHQNKLLSDGGVSKIDLSLYPTVSEQTLFISDLYKALYSKAEVIVFDTPEKSHSSAIDILTNLAVNGTHVLQARYAFQNNHLVEATGVLMQNSVGELSANGKYFIFVSDLSETKLADVLGPKLMQAAGDILHMDAYSENEWTALCAKFLDELRQRCSTQLSIHLQVDPALAEFCAKQIRPADGIAGIQSYIYETIYKALSEYILRNSVSDRPHVELFLSGDELVAIFKGKQEKKIVLSEWLPKKAADPLQEVKNELESVIGLTQVKEYVLDLENNLKIQRMRESAGLKKASVSMHMIFTGNPGTGKTTIARIVAKYLKAIGVLSIGQLREVSRGDLVGQYVGHTAKLTNEVVQSALGGVLFIDEAYALCRDKHDTFGMEAIDTLVKAMEDYRDDLVVILAGYRDEMEQFLQVNSGLKSRFPNIIEFPDYTPEEMVDIAVKIAGSKGYRIAEDCLDPLTRLFERSQIKGRNDSGNGRLARNVIESAILEQSKRLAQDPNSTAALDELIAGDFRFEQGDAFDLEQALSGIIGLDNVKDFVRTQYKLLIANEKRRKAGIQADTTQTLNMIFTGNPGTGKTTIARVVASMFKEMGLLKSGHLVETDRGGLVAEYVGQTAKKTEEVFRSALGGVLFIDEAYALADDGGGFGKEAIDTLVKLIEDYRGEIAVILAGYKKEMADFMKSNSGLQSRFPLQLDFPDYSANELYEIALKMIDAKGFRMTDEAKQGLREQMEWLHKTSTAHSGNGRMVRNAVEKILRNQSVRVALDEVSVTELTTILPSDLDTDDTRRSGTGDFDLEQALAPIIGLDEVKAFVRSLHARLRIQNERKKLGLPTDSSQTLHMIFKGNPGTGKTMVARIVADVLYHIGVIRTNKLIETDRAGLVAGYVGQTALKTTEKVHEALDGVLFIDEAYALSQGGANDFGKEAIDMLVKLMDDNRERLVVILAGYSNDMDEFLKTNPGLKSRFPNIIEFADYTLEQLMRIAEAFYTQKGYFLRKEAQIKLQSILAEALREEAFGNGRYVRNVFERSLNRQALRLSTDNDLTRDELLVIEADDIERV